MPQHADISIELTDLPKDPKNVPLSPVSSHLKGGLPRGFVGLIIFCFTSAIVSLIGFIGYSIRSSESGNASTLFESPTFLLALGIANSLVGSLQTASGYCCQRIAHKMVQLNPSGRSATRHPMYITGILLLAAGTIASVVNLGLLGQSVTAPFAALTLLYNAVLARFVLKESISRWDVYSSLMVISGVGLSVSGVSLAEIEVQSYILVEIEATFFRSLLPMFYTFALLTCLTIFSIYIKKGRHQESARGLFCYSVSAGVMAGFTSVTVKCSIELLKGAVQRGSGDMKNPVTYLFILAIPFSLVTQLRFMNSGFEHFGTLKFVPPYHAFIILANMVNGMVYFQEADEYGTISASLFISGCITTILGVMILLAKVPKTNPPEVLPEPITTDHI